jgi:ferredoxin-NADP reductase
MAGTAVRRRLTWQLGTVGSLIDETAAVRTIALDVPDWPGHRAGQHLDVRLTAEDGYRDELDALTGGVTVIHTLTRRQPPGWTGYARRVDAQMLAEVAWPAGEAPLAYACGPTSFVEAVAGGLVGLGYPPQRVKTERFGATGGP